jgi:hypothetical protein
MDPYLEKTEVGKVFLEADVQLKRVSRVLPARIRKRAKYTGINYTRRRRACSQAGYRDPDGDPSVDSAGEIMIGQTARGAYIYKASLKVMLEQDLSMIRK